MNHNFTYYLFHDLIIFTINYPGLAGDGRSASVEAIDGPGTAPSSAFAVTFDMEGILLPLLMSPFPNWPKKIIVAFEVFHHVIRHLTARENPYVALDGTVRVQNMSKFFI